jgi:outer membrane murein-binding lipoprotein Lpp
MMTSTTERLVAVLSAVTLLASCAETSPLERKNANSHVASEKAKRPADHDRLARQYENAAKQLQAKAEEQKKLLQHYEEKSYLYGRQAQDNESHAAAMFSKYQHDAAETMQQAAFHHRMASELAKREHAGQIAETPRLKQTGETGS